MSKNQLLEGKRIILTGASSGIGKALAYGLADLGAYMGLMGLSADELRNISEEITAKGDQSTFVFTNVMHYEEVEQAIDKMVQTMGGVDVLINNAGVANPNILPESPEDIDTIIDTNMKGPLYCSLAVLPRFIEQESGSIIITSSVSSLESTVSYLPYNVHYVTSKAGLNMYTHAMAARLEDKSIRVNALLPGFVDTQMIQHVQPELLERAGVMEPDELIPFYAFFASDMSKDITGRVLPVELFKSVLKFTSKLSPEQVESWETLEPLITARFSDPKYQVYGDAVNILQANHELLMMYISWGGSETSS
jgi:3-oxoacyl-[acyl-carrier protein] reductase